MKKAFEMPKIVVEQFVPNEYVAACGDSGTTYLFTCDAGGGVSGSVYVEDNGLEGLQTDYTWVEDSSSFFGGHYVSPDTFRSSYHACGAKHEAPENTGFLNGYYIAEGSREVVPVIIWTDNNTNTHCTTNLNKNTWETAKS